ncbi:tetratricopeptide repeat protein [Alteromonas lipotrueiana]|uniref:tetratricopeptide repeat protein n=1 Tax=Alteromonas lipotrueiana TaxID=2803815 RepID=UPI001C468C05|nr:tetratricopeptide repeat protein [Alteromonas lipotrueiana]
MQTIAIAALAVVLIGTTGCASKIHTEPEQVRVLRDDLFPSYHLFSVESAKEIFSLDDQASDFVRQSQSVQRVPHANMRELLNRIFDYSELGLLYQSSANSVASETFANRAANCLSLSVMTYSMARAAGFTAQFYQVDIPEYWTRRDGYNLLNGHINLRVQVAQNSHQLNLMTPYMDVDFDPQTVRSRFKRVPISKSRVVAMFYNNKGADALMANSYSRAYAYFKAAANADSQLGQVWVNLGVLYRKHQAYPAAEKSYQQAIALDYNNLTAWENLAILYRLTQRNEEADLIHARISAQRDSNPFYHFILGEEALEQGQPKVALVHYRTALRLDRSQHEVMAGMGRAFYELGDITQAERFLTRAANLASSEQDKARYQSKLSALQALN